MSAPYFALWRWVFVLALTLELPVVALAVRRPQRLRAVMVAVLGNAITHPALWFLWPRVMPYGAALVVGELVAVGVEGALLATLGKLGRRGVWIALFANLYSWAIGELILRGLGPALVRVWYGR
ncbi:MAG: hypothetical protein HYV09_19375 [Deltaproteobacteria bacterium]|nr:hypothetical protein [Deltaproteobacteria bacterium]